MANKQINYLYKIDDFEFLDGVFETCKYFQSQAYLIIVITNQAGIARGKYTEQDFEILTKWMIQAFKKENITISQVYHCPHHPQFSGECECRKPHIGMLREAQKEFDIGMSQSILVGDKNSDIEAQINAGIKTNYLISTGHIIKENKFCITILNNLHELIFNFKKVNKE